MCVNAEKCRPQQKKKVSPSIMCHNELVKMVKKECVKKGLHLLLIAHVKSLDAVMQDS